MLLSDSTFAVKTGWDKQSGPKRSGWSACNKIHSTHNEVKHHIMRLLCLEVEAAGRCVRRCTEPTSPEPPVGRRTTPSSLRRCSPSSRRRLSCLAMPTLLKCPWPVRSVQICTLDAKPPESHPAPTPRHSLLRPPSASILFCWLKPKGSLILTCSLYLAPLCVISCYSLTWILLAITLLLFTT